MLVILKSQMQLFTVFILNITQNINIIFCMAKVTGGLVNETSQTNFGDDPKKSRLIQENINIFSAWSRYGWIIKGDLNLMLSRNISPCYYCLQTIGAKSHPTYPQIELQAHFHEVSHVPYRRGLERLCCFFYVWFGPFECMFPTKKNFTNLDIY